MGSAVEGEAMALLHNFCQLAEHGWGVLGCPRLRIGQECSTCILGACAHALNVARLAPKAAINIVVTPSH